MGYRLLLVGVLAAASAAVVLYGGRSRSSSNEIQEAVHVERSAAPHLSSGVRRAIEAPLFEGAARLETGAVSGLVVDDAGSEPIEGAVVAFAVGREAHTAVTDAEGRFFIELALGYYRFEARTESSIGEGAADVLANETVELLIQLSPRARLRVRAEDENKIGLAGIEVAVLTSECHSSSVASALTGADGWTELHLLRGDYELSVGGEGFVTHFEMIDLEPGDEKTTRFELRRGTPLDVAVLDEQGAPVPDPTVSLIDSDGEETLGEATGEIGRSRVFAAPGPYTARVLVVGRRHETREVELSAAGRGQQLEIRLSRGLVVRGRVLDDEGRSFADVTVRLSNHGEHPDEEPVDLTVTTGADGAFQISGLQPGTYDLEHSAGGYMKREEQTEVLLERSDVVIDLRVRSLAEAIAGRVPECEGAEPGSCGVVAERAEDAGGPAEQTYVLVNERGEFELGRLRRGSYRVFAADPRNQPQLSSGNDVVVAAGTRGLVLHLDRSGQLLGTLAAPAPSTFMVTVQGHAHSFKEPQFEIADLIPGPATVTIGAPGYVPFEEDVEIAPGRAVRVHATLRPVVRFTGTIIDADTGHGLAGAQISALSEPIEIDAQEILPIRGRAESNLDGKFELTDLEPGRYRLDVVHAGHAPQRTAWLDLGPGGSAPMIVRLSRGVVVEGVITRGEQPLEKVMFRLEADDETFQRGPPTVFSDGEGRFRFTRIQPGTYRLTADFSEGGYASVVEVGPGGLRGLEIEFPAQDDVPPYPVFK